MKIKYYPQVSVEAQIQWPNVSKAFSLTLSIQNGSFMVMGGTGFIISVILAFSLCDI